MQALVAGCAGSLLCQWRPGSVLWGPPPCAAAPLNVCVRALLHGGLVSAAACTGEASAAPAAVVCAPRRRQPAWHGWVAADVAAIRHATSNAFCFRVEMLSPRAQLPPPAEVKSEALLRRLMRRAPAADAWEVGGSCNLLLAAARLGLRAAPVGNLGDDVYGRFLMHVLQARRGPAACCACWHTGVDACPAHACCTGPETPASDETGAVRGRRALYARSMHVACAFAQPMLLLRRCSHDTMRACGAGGGRGARRAADAGRGLRRAARHAALLRAGGRVRARVLQPLRLWPLAAAARRGLSAARRAAGAHPSVPPCRPTPPPVHAAPFLSAEPAHAGRAQSPGRGAPPLPSSAPASDLPCASAAGARDVADHEAQPMAFLPCDWRSSRACHGVQALRSTRALVINGFLFDELAPDVIMAAVATARNAGAAVFFDPGPRSWTLRHGARRAALDALLDATDVVLMTQARPWGARLAARARRAARFGRRGASQARPLACAPCHRAGLWAGRPCDVRPLCQRPLCCPDGLFGNGCYCAAALEASGSWAIRTSTMHAVHFAAAFAPMAGRRRARRARGD